MPSHFSVFDCFLHDLALHHFGTRIGSLSSLFIPALCFLEAFQFIDEVDLFLGVLDVALAILTFTNALILFKLTTDKAPRDFLRFLGFVIIFNWFKLSRRVFYFTVFEFWDQNGSVES